MVKTNPGNLGSPNIGAVFEASCTTAYPGFWRLVRKRVDPRNLRIVLTTAVKTPQYPPTKHTFTSDFEAIAPPSVESSALRGVARAKAFYFL
jgi:hypothetical protein